MSDDNEFAVRLDAVERNVAAARSDAAAARTDAAAARQLASAAYEDMSNMQLALNAHFRVLNALRETQLDHGRRLESLEGRFTGLETRFTGLETRFTGLETRFTGIETRFTGIETRFTGIETRFTGIEGRFDGLETEMREGFSVLNVGMAQITAMLTTLIGNSGQNGPAGSG
jgi:chromosome segregation ATPase